ncbi:capsid protein [Murine herpesvirus strain 4556]|uniref:Capsid scaffolding protein n=1 Tax=Murine herpesvirus TaxID=1431748 RepID=A0A6M4EHN8_9BETA|nr:capsid protein [Murine herpesvirus]QJQ80280.1 capsid protein [Murine herpesvirus]UNZ86646.1 capsid protein [Murine herpesvirus strain 72]UNZ86723.1 capsid protein [Murine herpesvirus strain 4556]
MADAPIYVGGYVDIKKYPTLEKELVLDHDRLLQAVPSFKPVPINVEHLADAEVGWVQTIYPASHGLFCMGEVTNKQFLHLVTQMAEESAASHITLTKQLPREPTLQMLHTWLPELSLSSISPHLMNSTPDTEIFHHVALCALGKRRGVVAVYGHSLDWVISKFESLKPGEISAIKECVESVSKRHGPNGQRPLNFSISMDSLLAKAIDASFIKNRLDLLKSDRQVAAVKQSAYLKASHVPQADPDPISQPTQSTIMTTVTAGMEENNLISVPKATLISLLTKAESSQRPQGGQASVPQILQPFQTPSSAITNHAAFSTPGAGLSYPHAGQWPIMPPWSPYCPPAYPLQASEGAPQSGPYWPPMYSYGHRDEARAGKRKRECEEEDQVSFPGETSKRGLYSELLSMAGSIASLKSELQSLKQSLPACAPPSTPASAYYPEAGSLLQYPGRHINPQQCYMSHPSPAPLPAASPAGAAAAPPPTVVESVPRPPETVPTVPVAQSVEREPDALVTTKKTVPAKRVDASKLANHEKSKVQQLFCEELSK